MGAGYWRLMLDGGYRILDAGWQMLDGGYWMLDGRYVKKDFMSYKNLEIWKLSRELTIEIHNMSLLLPNSNNLKRDNKSDGHPQQ